MRAALLTAFAVMGCSDELSTEPIHGPACLPLQCTNSGEVARYGMFDASLEGQPDVHGLFLESYKGRAQLFLGDKTFDLHVENGQLFGTRDGVVLEHGDLATAELHVWTNDGPLYNITINRARMIEMPFGTIGKHEVYDMTWHPVGKPPSDEELCNPSEWSIDRRDRMGMTDREVIVFEGDRYDAESFTLNTDEAWDPSWFNFGCSGRTLAKMRLLGKSQANQEAPTQSWNEGWAARQATFKMLGADYCGRGRPYTLTGVPVMYSDGDHIPYPLAPTKVEAVWTEKGAICVNHPRLENVGIQIWQDMIDDDCLPLNCDTLYVPGPGLGPTDFGPDAKVITAYWQ